MKKQIALLLGIVLFGANVFGQDFNIKWSDPLEYDDAKDGMFHSYLSANSTTTFLMLGGGSTKRKAMGIYKKMKIIGLDLKTKKKVSEAGLYGFNATDKKEHKGLKYYKTVVFEDAVHVFWKKTSKKSTEIYMESFDGKLKRKGKLAKIYQKPLNKKADKNPSVFVLINRSIEKILIGAELGGKEGDNIRIELKILEKNLKFSKAMQVTLPYATIKTTKKKLFSSNRYAGLTSNYELGDDGNLHLETFFSLDRKERKARRKAGTLDDFVPMLYGSVNLSSGKIKYKQISFKGKSIQNVQKIVGKKSTKLFGFFSDNDKGKGSSDIHGVFYGILSPDYQVKNVKFNYFTKAQLDKLFKGDKEDRYEMVGGCFGIGKKKKKKTDDGDELAGNYDIDFTVTSDSDELVLFCSKTDKWSTTHCSSNSNGGQTCTTTYHLRKRNVTVFKLDSKGDLIWASNLDRNITYSGGISVWYIEDVNVVAKNGSFYCIYGNTDKDKSKSKAARKKERKVRAKIRPFEYAVFDGQTGDVKRKHYAVNKIDTPTKERKTITARGISVIGNKFYTEDTRMRYKATACLWSCGAGWLWGSIKKGEGFIGEIEVLEK